MPRATLNIFISYGRADGRELALRLRDDLQRIGHNVWLDLDEIPGGADWSQRIEDAIEHCDVTLALMSRASFDSQWCRAEQLRALRKGKRVIPLRLQATAEIPLALEHLNYLDFSEAARYDAMLRDLLSDLSAGSAFAPQAESATTSDSPFATRSGRDRSPGRTDDEKRDAAAFRRVLHDLRTDPRLGARSWWPYFLFLYVDIHTLNDVLAADQLTARDQHGPTSGDRWAHFVRLHFRPRPPQRYHTEGFRPVDGVQPAQADSIPVCLLFDLEALLLNPEARISAGDPARTGKTARTAAFFRQLPFDQIYHDGWFSADERDEILAYRDAQVLLPDATGLEALQFIWLRSPAEYETLRELLPAELWQRWRDKVTARADHSVFYHHRVYVQQADLHAEYTRLRFNQPQRDPDCGPFWLQARADLDDGSSLTWSYEDAQIMDDMLLNLPGNARPYSLQVTLNGALAYAGRYDNHWALR